jgi:hypothetical protein
MLLEKPSGRGSLHDEDVEEMLSNTAKLSSWESNGDSAGPSANCDGVSVRKRILLIAGPRTDRSDLPSSGGRPEIIQFSNCYISMGTKTNANSPRKKWVNHELTLAQKLEVNSYKGCSGGNEFRSKCVNTLVFLNFQYTKLVSVATTLMKSCIQQII